MADLARTLHQRCEAVGPEKALAPLIPQASSDDRPGVEPTVPEKGGHLDSDVDGMAVRRAREPPRAGF